ncbi:MAG TPA: hypothetical protein VNT22_10730 [Baekduia sp.]|nr:hypothetical protein [Baekduia sp.]
MQRRFPLLVAAVIVFIAVAVLLARFLSVEGQERDAIASLLKQRTHGPVKIIRLDSATAYSIGTDEGWTRVVWAPTAKAEPVVQCVRVRRHGGPLTARAVKLLSLRPPLSDNEGSC